MVVVVVNSSLFTDPSDAPISRDLGLGVKHEEVARDTPPPSLPTYPIPLVHLEYLRFHIKSRNCGCICNASDS